MFSKILFNSIQTLPFSSSTLMIYIYMGGGGYLKAYFSVGEWGWGVEGKQVGSMDKESQVRGCYNITFICTPTNQETVSVLEKTQANKTFRT